MHSMSPLIPVAVAVVAVTIVLLIVVRRRSTAASIEPDRARLFEIQNEWRAPFELESGPLPRAVALSTQGKVAIGFGLLFLAGGCVLSVMGYRSLTQTQERQRMIREEGVETQGDVVRKWVSSGGKSRTYRIVYRFNVDGRIYQRSAVVGRDDYDRTNIGDKVQLRYVPANPLFSRLAIENRPVPVWVALIPPAFFLMILLLVVEPILSQRKLLQWGKPVGALVVHLSPVKGGKVVRYEFLDGVGNVVSGSSTVSGADVPEVGTIVTVVHDQNNSTRNVLYPPQMLRVKSAMSNE